MLNPNATRNPFKGLSVEREAEELGSEKTEPVTITMPLVEPKKRKVRPEEKGKLKEKTLEEKEGFYEVRKSSRPLVNLTEDYIAPQKMKINQRPGDKFLHFVPRARGNKRVFDRHSGTGRGREIAKNGAGGKTTWGNIDQIANENVIDYMAAGEEENYIPIEETYFNDALKVKTNPLEAFEAVKPIEVPIESPLATIPVEIIPDHLETKKEEKRRKKNAFIEEKLDEKNRMERPENGVSYQEYLEKLKKKNENLMKETRPPVEHRTITENPLEVSSKPNEEQEYQQWMTSLHQKKNKGKKKFNKVDSTEEELNRMVGQQLTLTGEYYKSR